MTSSRYFIALFAKAFGYVRKSQRMGEAASEMHLLREAEAQLGAMIWQNVEEIEDLSVEYWNLRKLIKEHDVVRAKLASCQERLDQAHEERASLINVVPEVRQDLHDERAALLTELELLTRQRDQIVADAREVRRAYIGLKVKLEVLTKEAPDSPANQETTSKVRIRLAELKVRFAELKQDRMRIGEEIARGDLKIDQIDEKFREQRQERRSQASDAFQVIGECNRDLSVLRAESSLYETRIRQMQAEIGRYVSRHTNRDPACAAAAAQYHGLIDVMRALRRSIALNHRLAGTA